VGTSGETLDILANLPPGQYEVRVVDEIRATLVIFYNGETAMAAIKLSSEEAHRLSVLLVRAAERTAYP
jgi:hypothetical protein